MFLERMEELRATLRRALESGDAAALGRGAHALKGAVSNFTTGVAYQSAARIEQLAAQPLSGELSEEVERLEGALVELETQLRGLLRAPTNVS